MCPPVKWGWCLKSFKRRYTFFIFFSCLKWIVLWYQNILMMGQFTKNLNLMLLQVQQHMEYCICFVIKSFFFRKDQERVRKCLEKLEHDRIKFCKDYQPSRGVCTCILSKYLKKNYKKWIYEYFNKYILNIAIKIPTGNLVINKTY